MEILIQGREGFALIWASIITLGFGLYAYLHYVKYQGDRIIGKKE